MITTTQKDPFSHVSKQKVIWNWYIKIHIFIDNIFVMFGGRVFPTYSRIPMGIYCHADLFPIS